MRQIAFCLFLFVSLMACKQEQKDTTPEEKNPLSHSMPTMIDVVGVYEGDMPCEKCDKEMVTVNFKMDKSVIETIARVGGEGGSTAGIGTWELDGEQVKLAISTGDKSYTLKGKQLQKTVGGKTYVLKKIEE